MKIDEAIRMFDWAAKQDRPLDYLCEWASKSSPGDDKKTFAKVAKWLKELLVLREHKKRCDRIHQPFFDELAKQGVTA